MAGVKPPSTEEITAIFREFDGSGQGILAVRQAKAAVRDIESLGLSADEIELHVDLAKDVAGDGQGRIKLEPFASYLAFEALKKYKMAQKKQAVSQPQPQAPQTAAEDNPFVDFLDAAPSKPSKPSKLQNALSPMRIQVEPAAEDVAALETSAPKDMSGAYSPTAAIDIPTWFGHSVDSPMVDDSEDTKNDDPFALFGGFADDTQTNTVTEAMLAVRKRGESKHTRAASTPALHKPSPGLIAPPRSKKDGKLKSPKGDSKKRKSKPRLQPQTSFQFAMHFDGEEEYEVVKKEAGAREKAEEAAKDTSDAEAAVEEALADDDEAEKEKPKKEERRPRTDAVAEMKRGTAMLKYGRRGFPHFRRFQLSKDNSKLMWFSRRKGLNETHVEIKDIRDVMEGQQTEVFKQCTQRTLEKASFSVVYGSKLKSLDVVAKSYEEAQLWIKGIKGLVRANRQGKLHKVSQILVDVNYTDITKPNYRAAAAARQRREPATGFGNIELLRTVEATLEQSQKTFESIVGLAKADTVAKSDEYENIQTLVSEIETRLEEVDFALSHKTEPLANLKRDVWVLKVDVTVLEEKLKVLNKGAGFSLGF